MSNLSQENIEWAAKSLADGRSIDFIASVLEVKPRKALSVIRSYRPARKASSISMRYAWQASDTNSTARENAEKYFQQEDSAQAEEAVEKAAATLEKVQIDESVFRNRRRFLLSARFSKHWDMIWYCLSRGMSGRSVRSIYGSECLIWATGGGVDAEIE